MIIYEIDILTLICEVHDAHPNITHSYYANDVGLGGNFSDLRLHLGNLMVRGPHKANSLSQPRSSWLSWRRISRRQRPTSVGWNWSWSPEAATLEASLVTRSLRPHVSQRISVVRHNLWRRWRHRWELPVLHYHKIMLIYPYPSLVVITQFFSWIIFIRDCICILTGSTW